MIKQVLMTGMRPTSRLHVGNFFGALKHVINLQNKYKVYLMIADLHALTTLENSEKVAENSLNIAMLYLAGGVDPKKVTIFAQSQIPEHSELAAIFSMVTPVSMLQLNPVYKEMISEHPRATNLGLLAYPVLQAADILAYKAAVVPVGKDQLPHLELAREIARRFNSRFGKMFHEPKTELREELKILSLTDPAKKMSKSHADASQIGLLDSPDAIRKKIKSAVTDSGREVAYNPKKKPAVSNLLMLMHLSSGRKISELEKHFKGKGYGEFKSDVAESLVGMVTPFQTEYFKLAKNKTQVYEILGAGAKEARAKAASTLKEAKKKIGLL